MVLITAQLGVARPDWGQREVRNITPGTHPHLGKLGWRHILPMQESGSQMEKASIDTDTARRASGRTRREPAKFKDFVKY